MQQHDLLDHIEIDEVFNPYHDQHSMTTLQPAVYSGPVWMDDLCITMKASSADAALHKAGMVSSLLLDTLVEHAMSPNLSKGKTELLLSLRGRGVRRLKAAHLSEPDPCPLEACSTLRVFGA